VGYGNVGSRVAKRALAFGMQVLVYDPYVALTQVEGQGIEMTDLTICWRSPISCPSMPG